MQKTDTLIFKSPIGHLELVASANQLLEINFISQRTQNNEVTSRHLQKSYQQLLEYFNGQRKNWNISLHQEGTPFQLKVWQAISQIPYGAVKSYSAIAEEIGHPRSYRAVSNACGQNKIPIIIPCHRVVGKSDLGGYTPGLKYKKALLKLEGVL